MSCHCIGALINPKCPEHGSMHRLRQANSRLRAESSKWKRLAKQLCAERDVLFEMLHENGIEVDIKAVCRAAASTLDD